MATLPGVSGGEYLEIGLGQIKPQIKVDSTETIAVASRQ